VLSQDDRTLQASSPVLSIEQGPISVKITPRAPRCLGLSPVLPDWALHLGPIHASSTPRLCIDVTAQPDSERRVRSHDHAGSSHTLALSALAQTLIGLGLSGSSPPIGRV
jgi:hypothetical protein